METGSCHPATLRIRLEGAAPSFRGQGLAGKVAVRGLPTPETEAGPEARGRAVGPSLPAASGRSHWAPAAWRSELQHRYNHSHSEEDLLETKRYEDTQGRGPLGTSCRLPGTPDAEGTGMNVGPTSDSYMPLLQD